MEKKIYRSLCGMGVAAALVCSLLIFAVMRFGATAQLRQSVRDSAYALADVWNAAAAEPAAFSSQDAGSLRITLLRGDGSVLYDSAGATESHADRPEFKAALRNGFGENTRLSDTLQTQTYYYAVRLQDGGVLRTSAATRSVYAQLVGGLPFLFLAVAFVSILSAFTAAALTKRLLAPVNAVDVEHPLAADSYEELAPLLRRIDRQNRELTHQLETVASMRDDLADIMENMSEGLVVLSSSGTVLSANRAALALLHCRRQDCLGKPLLTLHRDAAFLQLMEAVQAGRPFAGDLSLEGRIYRLSLSQAARGGSLLMLVDETEKRGAEQLRREFSANVSHELKTPLQAISGYAELLRGGMVREADKPHFYESIYGECQRLIALVRDIIRLSQLDEGALPVPQGTVDLLALARQAAQTLEPKAAQKQVTLTVTGESALLQGDAAPLGELVFNLIDNAVSYNRSGGSAEARLEVTGDLLTLTVSDTGIGIPPQHQQRIFERFYRVDQSHSRATGGTGLGLSIVKHVAALYHATLTLESSEGEGTRITVAFPRGEAPASL